MSSEPLEQKEQKDELETTRENQTPEPMESGNNRESVENLEIAPQLITCPYNNEHQVPSTEFNDHIWQCRADKMAFYPHALSLKRCKYNMTHFLPEEEIPFHELFCKSLTEPLYNLVATEPIVLNVSEYLEEHRRMKAYNVANGGASTDSDSDSDSESGRDKDDDIGSVSSEIADSEVDEEDEQVMVKRLECLKIEKVLNP